MSSKRQSDSFPSLTSSETSCPLYELVTECAECDVLQQSPETCSLLNVLDDDRSIFLEHGYQKMSKICDTLQGELWKALRLDGDPINPTYVAVKRIGKPIYKSGTAIENGSRLCVSEDILKERSILHYLTIQNKPIGQYIARFVDFFESDDHFYLVTEYVESCTNLKEFIVQCRQHIRTGRLSLLQYHKMMKYILWQLFVTVEWMHRMNCCHLDLCTENIMLANARFVKTERGVAINPQISVRLCDFGVAEIFKRRSSRTFKCEKSGLSISNECWFAPKVFSGEVFDAEVADTWSLGMILFETLTIGLKLYAPATLYAANSGYHCVLGGQVTRYLASHGLLHYFNRDSLTLLQGLLQVSERRRLKGIRMLQSDWFGPYFSRYEKQLARKYAPSAQLMMKRQKKLSKQGFPFYK